MSAYYNDIDPFAAEWLRQLIDRDLIAPGDIDERSIEDVAPDELVGYTQCHFFAGIGVWSHAIRQAGWPDDRPVWTGSCPCQPFSSAGKRGGFDDERHLWPAWFWHIQQLRPEHVFGEQVAGKAGETWFDLVSNDLEGEGYSIGAAVTAACGFGAPHQRKRLYFVAHSDSQRRVGKRVLLRQEEGGWNEGDILEAARSNEAGELADTEASRRGLVHATDEREADAPRHPSTDASPGPINRRGPGPPADDPGPTNGVWRTADWLFCRDGKWRPVESGSFPLADVSAAGVGRGRDIGLPSSEGRVMRLKGYGNALVSEQARSFIESYMEVERDE